MCKSTKGNVSPLLCQTGIIKTMCIMGNFGFFKIQMVIQITLAQNLWDLSWSKTHPNSNLCVILLTPIKTCKLRMSESQAWYDKNVQTSKLKMRISEQKMEEIKACL